MSDLSPPLLGALLAAALAAAALVVALRARGRARAEAEQARAEATALRRRLEALEQRAASQPATPPNIGVEADRTPTYVGRVVDETDAARPVLEATPVTGPAFADLVLRESVIRLASLAHGVRRAVGPEQRNRIRFEMGREVKRSRRARRDELKAALRDYQARQRAQADPREDAA